jgi:O-antigen ligase
VTGAVLWNGVCDQKNGLTFLCTLSLFYFAWTFFRRRKGRDRPVVWYQTYIEISIVLLSIYLFMGPRRTLTYSATALGVLIISLICLAGLSWLKNKNIIISANALTIFIVAIIIYGTITPFVGRLTLFDPSSLLNREETLTGRAAIWDTIVPLAMQKPFLGHGFGGFWTGAKRYAIAATAHNGYLDTIVDTGFIGLFVLSMFLISNCRKAQKLMTQDFDWGIVWFCFVLMAVVRNIAESSVTSLIGTQPALLLVFLISYSSKLLNHSESKTPEP